MKKCLYYDILYYLFLFVLRNSILATPDNMSESNHYKRTTKASLEGELLITIRIQHVKQIAHELVLKNIVSKQYLDNLIKIKELKKQHMLANTNNTNDTNNTNNVNHIIYNDEIRIELLESLLQKESTKGTARMINELCEKHNK